MSSLENSLEQRDRLEWDFYQAQCRYNAIQRCLESRLGGDITRNPGLIGRVTPSDVATLDALHTALRVLLASVNELVGVNQKIPRSASK